MSYNTEVHQETRRYTENNLWKIFVELRASLRTSVL